MNHTKRGHSSVPLIFIAVSLLLLSVLYFIVKEENLKLMILIMSLTVLLIGIIIFYLSTTAIKRKLHKQIKKLSANFNTSNLDILKQNYMDIYYNYMKLSEHKKQNYYGSITKLRQDLEEKLKAQKKLELLLQEASVGSIEEQKQKYTEIEKLFSQLPFPNQEKYTSTIQHLKEKLEKGLNSN